MGPLKDVLPPTGDVFYDFETRQNTEFCSRCEDAEDGCDCVRFGTRRLSFWQDPAGELLSYLTEPRPWANKVIAIKRNAKAFDLHFILKRALLLKWKPDLIMNGHKMVYIRMEQLMFLDSVSFLPFPLPVAFGLTVGKSW